MHQLNENFQTPPNIVKYMVSLIPDGVKTVLEPTPGLGNIIRELESRGYMVYAPDNFFKYNEMDVERTGIDCVVMNPPFSSKYAFGVPAEISHSGMRLGYYILTECMKMSDIVIALMPWFTISDSDVRLRYLKQFGLKSITALPRKTFQYARIQTVVLHLQKGYRLDTVFKTIDEALTI
ncbi:hypothetical protein [Proteiniphilum sp.]|uniref:hypothetical protein n=1 Tax=Proteiniphilum sp. TaxID=1926877 RepID=UPI00331A365A